MLTIALYSVVGIICIALALPFVIPLAVGAYERYCDWVWQDVLGIR